MRYFMYSLTRKWFNKTEVNWEVSNFLLVCRELELSGQNRHTFFEKT